MIVDCGRSNDGDVQNWHTSSDTRAVVEHHQWRYWEANREIAHRKSLRRAKVVGTAAVFTGIAVLVALLFILDEKTRSPVAGAAFVVLVALCVGLSLVSRRRWPQRAIGSPRGGVPSAWWS